MDRVYLDHAATTPVDERVLNVMMDVYKYIHGNASSIHALGNAARDVIENARETIAKCFGVEPVELIFTGSGTEADNLAIQGVAFRRKKKGKHIITSGIEHPAVRNTCRYLAKEFGFSLTEVPVDHDGIIDVDAFQEAIRSETILATVMTANNEVGTIQPIKAIGDICTDKDIVFHTDAVQAFGKIPLDPSRDKFDLLSMSAHKIYGPKGVGLLYLKGSGTRNNEGGIGKPGRYIQPVLQGGGHESGMRPATENVAGIAGLAKAVQVAFSTMDENASREVVIRDHIIKTILENIPASILNGHPLKRLPNNINISFKGCDGEALLTRLDIEGYECSTGSACSSKKTGPSHVLAAMGLENEYIRGSLRITIGRSTTMELANNFLEILEKIVQNLRSFSPTWQG